MYQYMFDIAPYFKKFKMEVHRKTVVEQEQIDIDDEMAEDDDEEEADDNSWLGSLGALLTPCRPIYHSTQQPLYPELSVQGAAQMVQADALKRIAEKLHEQNQAIMQQAAAQMQLASQQKTETGRSIQFKNADVTITKINRTKPLLMNGANTKSKSAKPVSVVDINNGNTHANLDTSRFESFSSIALK